MDDSATVGEITKTVCDRIGIINPEEFCLYPEQETAEMTLRRVSEVQLCMYNLLKVSLLILLIATSKYSKSEKNGQDEGEVAHR